MPESKWSHTLAKLGAAQGEPPKAPAALPADLPEKPARPLGKSSDPAYIQRGYYIRKDILKPAEKRLDKRSDGADMSDLFNFLLAQWLTTPE